MYKYSLVNTPSSNNQEQQGHRHQTLEVKLILSRKLHISPNERIFDLSRN